MLQEADSSTSSSSSPGLKWSNELLKLRSCGSSYELSLCLRQIIIVLNSINRQDRIKFCQSDFNVSISTLKVNPLLWNENIKVLILDINSTYFNKNYFQYLSIDTIEEIFQWIPTNEFAPVLSICQEWYKLGKSNNIWKQFYYSRFLKSNSTCVLNKIELQSYYFAFKVRLGDPQLGDKVEVSWRGKFRLEASEVYRGSAWWIAEIVDRQPLQGKYKIRYPGWDQRWDEWVPQHRLRWAVESNIVARIQVGDAVEVWCCGASVPGAWLEANVVATATGKYCVGDVLMSGDLWVNRDRLRLAKPRQITRENDNSAETDLSLSSPQSNATNDSNSRRSFVERTLSFSGISLGSTPPRSSRSFSQSENQPCTIM